MSLIAAKGADYDAEAELKSVLTDQGGEADWGRALADVKYATMRKRRLAGYAWRWSGDLYVFTLGLFDMVLHDAGIPTAPRFTILTVQPRQARDQLETIARTRL